MTKNIYLDFSWCFLDLRLILCPLSVSTLDTRSCCLFLKRLAFLLPPVAFISLDFLAIVNLDLNLRVNALKVCKLLIFEDFIKYSSIFQKMLWGFLRKCFDDFSQCIKYHLSLLLVSILNKKHKLVVLFDNSYIIKNVSSSTSQFIWIIYFQMKS